jgi:hypothetical protein
MDEKEIDIDTRPRSIEFDAGRATRMAHENAMRLAQSEAIDKMHAERRATIKKLKLGIPNEKHK